jgi:hypothetical protein
MGQNSMFRQRRIGGESVTILSGYGRQIAAALPLMP